MGSDLSAFARSDADGESTLNLMVDGLQCGACVWLIESVLSRQAGVTWARLNMTTRRLVLKWRTAEANARDLVAAVSALGYRLVPYDAHLLGEADERRDKALLRAMSVAGFAAGNIMLLSVSIWSGHSEGMATATRDLLHWLSALIALPTIAYAGRPFFASALSALKARRTNMDVPISLALILAPGMSLVQTLNSAEHAYFDSAVTLLFFLLVGRYLDTRARGKARSAATELLMLTGTAVTVLDASGAQRALPSDKLRPRHQPHQRGIPARAGQAGRSRLRRHHEPDGAAAPGGDRGGRSDPARGNRPHDGGGRAGPQPLRCPRRSRRPSLFTGRACHGGDDLYRLDGADGRPLAACPAKFHRRPHHHLPLRAGAGGAGGAGRRQRPASAPWHIAQIGHGP
jgi:copper chaperone CopZ